MTGFYTGKRVIVTGGPGFLGSHLVEALVHRGAVVTVMDDRSRGDNRLPMGVQFVHADVGDESACRTVFQGTGAEVVFNLAAWVAGVLYNQTHQLEMFERNLRLQLAPVQTAATLQIEHFLQVSSVCVYAPGYAPGAVEEDGQKDDPVVANAGYAWAKRLGERAVGWAGLPHAVIVRPSNLYGPRDYFDDRAHVIPALIRKCLERDIIEVHGTGDELREFLYVEDAAEGLLAAMEYGSNGAVYNIGTNGETMVSIAELIEMIQRLTDMVHKPLLFTGGDAGDAARWNDCIKAKDSLGWTYHVGLEEGLRETIEWYQHQLVRV